jgi:nucleotide-binding universal stress UspA family protein
MHVPPDLRMAGEWFATLRGHAVAGLDRCGDRLDAAGVKYETHLENKHPVEAIVQLALRVEADLVVIGSRGHGGVAQLLLGSVAQATLRAAPCPVLTVPPAN